MGQTLRHEPHELATDAPDTTRFRMNSTRPDFRAPVRIGAVSYLNSKPLVEGLEQDLAKSETPTELVLDFPSRLAGDLAAGRLDVALVPSIECLRNADYEIVTDACVATRGPVLSVKLYSRVPIPDITSLALDEGSRTSATLARILLAEKHGLYPLLEPLPLGRSVDATTADAILVIGDRAMHQFDEPFVETWDLGAVWSQWTGLPFVFAAWAARRDTDLGDTETALVSARNRGVTELESIAARESRELGIPAATASDYLHNNLHFHLGPAEHQGLLLFQRLAIAQDLADASVDLAFRGHPQATTLAGRS